MVSIATEKPKSFWDLWVKPVQKDNTRFSGSKQTHSFPDNWGRGKRDGAFGGMHIHLLIFKPRQ